MDATNLLRRRFVLPGCGREDRKEPPPEKAVGPATSAVTQTAPGFAPSGFIRIDRSGR